MEDCIDATESDEKIHTRLTGIALHSKGWLKFLGVLFIIYGIITALSLVGILIAWLPIWMGVLLFQAGKNGENAGLTNEATHLVTMMDKLRVYFVVQGVLAIIGLIATVIFGIVMIWTGGALLSNFGRF